MTSTTQRPSKITWLAIGLLIFVAAISLSVKIGLIGVGAPYTTIDDYTLFNAGFLVWFGEAPPQRTYIESWLVGLSSITTYVTHLLASGQLDHLGLNLIADAYRDFYQTPQPYVENYRWLMLSLDMATAAVVYLIAIEIFRSERLGYLIAIISTCFFLLSFNTLWCYLVARPDTPATLFSAIGIWFYFRYLNRQSSNQLIVAAIALGIATGFKLHAAMLVIFFAIDLIRSGQGLRNWKLILAFCSLSFFCFLVSAGSPLFDPSLYIKLRALNIRDDASPWIHWGDQFLVMLKNTGWLFIPLFIAIGANTLLKGEKPSPRLLGNLIFIVLCFLLAFAAIRQLRGYWMLPALPVFYALLAYWLVVYIRPAAGVALTAIALCLFGYQLYQQSSEFKNANYAQLQTWVQQQLKPSDKLYIIGYDTLFLPCNTRCIQTRTAVINDLNSEAISNGEPFTHRHIRLWEEHSQLTLFNMLNYQSDQGFDYYSFYQAPLAVLEHYQPFSNFNYVVVMQGFHAEGADELISRVKSELHFVATVNAPGGKAGTGGLAYDIYAKATE